jgi:hypothetical protein
MVRYTLESIDEEPVEYVEVRYYFSQIKTPVYGEIPQGWRLINDLE